MNKRHFYAGLGQAVNRAMQLDNTGAMNYYGDLVRTSAGDGFGVDDLYLPGAWLLEARVRVNAANTADDFQSLVGRLSGTAAEYALMYRSTTRCFGLDSFQYNATGGLIYCEIPVVAPLGAWHTVKFSYDGTTLWGYLNGTLALQQVVQLGFVNTRISTLSFGFGNSGSYRPNADIDYVRLEKDAVRLVDIDFNEASGPAHNRGALGGEVNWTNGNPRLLV